MPPPIRHIPPLPPVPPLPPLPAVPPSPTPSWWRTNGATLLVGAIGLVGVIATGTISYKIGGNQSEAAATSLTEQFFIQERRQAYGDFYSSLLSVIALDERSNYSNDINVDPAERVKKALDNYQSTTAELRNRQATLELVGSTEIGDIAADIVKVRTYVAMIRVAAESGQETPGDLPSDFNLETFDKQLLTEPEGEQQLYETFLKQARFDLGTDGG
ncbi:hypothetical protein HQO42_05410 [Rhodococcus fascians]|nr:hypothetical protein [Rhodococcus fascians]MBY4236557.1 hypothetical protein [Rhodococcus fascians]MBY4252076.1 hypothetical protein [Rhodococcus fascians]MBY4267903.1 hypothetical protein [Rhodococcus fascians]